MFNGRTQDYDDSVIQNNGFWCDISVGEFQKQRAIPLQIPVEMVKTALIAAMQGLNLDLAEVEENHRKSAVNSVQEISAQRINGC
ncbi:head completion/stabilization protein [Rodentibacter rarus]|uniref:head completion/stabilization protein n=1 Tax=Rodentibacter rarus TaxID=1908260 RepID=UPI002118A1C6|nr:head completion/stabilization protein [Rodentibacter rarus]